MSSKNLPKIVVGGVVAAVLAVGAWMLGNSGASNASTTAAAAQRGAGGQLPQNGQVPEDGQGPPDGSFDRRRGTPPGFGAIVTGTTAQKVAKAALARYPGRIERIFRLSDGSFVAHVITSSGEIHVAVSRDLKVTGAFEGGPPVPGAGAHDAQPGAPGGSAPDDTTSSDSTKS